MRVSSWYVLYHNMSIRLNEIHVDTAPKIGTLHFR